MTRMFSSPNWGQAFRMYNNTKAWGYDPYLPLELKISTNYDGTSSPSTATWTDITFDYYTGSSYWQWTNSGDIDLSTYKTSNVHIAFIYKADATNDATWEIDDITILDPIK